MIDNALQFQHKTENQIPVIKITANQADGNLQICVEDNGIGVSESHRDIITMPLKRLHHDKDYVGLGMGLAYCERIARIHGGTLTFDHSSQGGLSVVYTESAKS